MGMEDKSILTELRDGRLSEGDAALAEGYLMENWSSFDGSHEGGMRADKIPGRTENMTWSSPVLSFTIERHGGTVNGSTRAELQHWEVDTTKRRAEIVSTSRRQLHAQSQRLDVRPIAADVVHAITSGKAEDYLVWKDPGRVRIRLEHLIPFTFKETTVGRRKRLREALAADLKAFGWRLEMRGSYTYFVKDQAM